jgi:polysaccharide biosynthesis protein PelD
MTRGQDEAIRRTRRWLETLAITLSGPALGMAFHSKDPFWMHAPVPWLVILPLLTGAQYGLAHGVVSSAILSALAYVYGDSIGRPEPLLLSSWGLGALIIGAIAGQFRDAREERTQRANALVAHLSERVERAERAGRLLKLSHERLEERLAATRWSLGGSVETAQRRMLELCSRRELGEVVLDVLASQAMVQVASLYWAGSGQQLLPLAVATLGASGSGKQLHPLVLRAWKTRRLVAVRDLNEAISGDDGSVLAAAPVITSSGHLVGVVAIHQMPFMAFQSEQLRSLLMIVGQLGDMMNDRLRELAHQNMVSARSSVQVSPVAPAALGHSPSTLDMTTPATSAVSEVSAAST